MGALAIAALAQLPQFGLGLWQAIKGSNMNVDRPEMPIPESARAALGLARNEVGQANMPGYSQGLDNINRSLAGVMGSAGQVATGSGQALEALTNAAAMGMQQKGALDAQNAANRQRAREMLGSQLDRMANFEMSKWGWDFQQKFQEDAAAKSALIGSGIQNTAGSLSSFGQMAFMNKLYGGNQPGAGGGVGDAITSIIGKSAMNRGQSALLPANKPIYFDWREELGQMPVMNIMKAVQSGFQPANEPYVFDWREEE